MQKIFHSLLSHITVGHLVVRDANGEKQFGTPGTTPSSVLTIHNPAFYKRVMKDGSLGLGESYMDGWWDVENNDLVSFIAILFTNRLYGYLPKQLKLVLHLIQQKRLSKPKHSKDNIQYHYDIGNDFYELFLDKNMGYTCGYQVSPSDTIEQMQDQKHELVCRKLQLKKGERIIDLGCGFGGMLRYSAKNYGISGVGYTLSEGQAEWANAKIKEEGLQDRIRVELKDYRDATGPCDKVVSIGMAEHAWQKGYGTLFGKIESLLPDGGLGFVHTIGSTVDPSHETDRWITRYIFPGGRIPRLQELVFAANEAGLTIGHIENLKPHYAETLRHWAEKFHKNTDAIKALGPQYDERFLRMWDFYLQGCDAAFRYSSLQLYQVLFCKGEQWTLPMNMEFGIPVPGK